MVSTQLIWSKISHTLVNPTHSSAHYQPTSCTDKYISDLHKPPHYQMRMHAVMWRCKQYIWSVQFRMHHLCIWLPDSRQGTLTLVHSTDCWMIHWDHMHKIPLHGDSESKLARPVTALGASYRLAEMQSKTWVTAYCGPRKDVEGE